MTDKLTARACVPCRGGIPPLTRAEFSPMLEQVPEWEVKDDKLLVRDFAFKDFKGAMAFVNRVADLAEAEGHHPNIFVHDWNKVRLELYTHKIGGLHENDFILAAKSDALYE